MSIVTAVFQLFIASDTYTAWVPSKSSCYTVFGFYRTSFLRRPSWHNLKWRWCLQEMSKAKNLKRFTTSEKFDFSWLANLLRYNLMCMHIRIVMRIHRKNDVELQPIGRYTLSNKNVVQIRQVILIALNEGMKLGSFTNQYHQLTPKTLHYSA